MDEMRYQIKETTLNKAHKLIKVKAEIDAGKEIKEVKETREAIKKLVPIPLPNYLEKFANPAGQPDYVRYYQAQVKFAVDCMKVDITNKDDVSTLMSMMAWQRRVFALGPGRNYAGFGNPREKRETLQMVTPLKGPYAPYIKRINPTPKEVEEWVREIIHKGVTLTRIPFLPQIGLGPTLHFYHEGIDDTKKRKELLDEFYAEYLALCKADFKGDKNAAKRAIGRFHWLGANLVPWDRGSASLMEQLVDALWIHHFNWAPEKTLGVALDCEALLATNREAYANQYPDFPPIVPITEEEASLDQLALKDKVLWKQKLEREARWKVKFESGYTLLALSLLEGELDIFNASLSAAKTADELNKLKIDSVTPKGTALMIALELDAPRNVIIDVVEKLLAKQANPELRNSKGETALMTAITQNNHFSPKLVTALLKAGADKEAILPPGGRNPIFLAVETDNSAIVDAILSAIPPVNVNVAIKAWQSHSKSYEIRIIFNNTLSKSSLEN